MTIGNRRVSVAEILLVFGILLVAGAPVLRIIYGEREREWERAVLQRLGIQPELAWLVSGVVAVAFMTWRVWRRANPKE